MPAEDFAAGLSMGQKYSANFIDNAIQLFEGLCKFTTTEPETVRKMFLDLFKDDGGDLDLCMSKIQTFLNARNALNKKYNKPFQE